MKLNIPAKSVPGFSLPVLGLGTWQMGGQTTHDPGNDDARDIAAIVAAIDGGITHLDTAEVYAEGWAERFVGEAIRQRGRQGIFITSKVLATHLRHDDVIAACRGSLERIGIKQLDLYLVHAPNREVPLSETMRALDWLRENELIRFAGVSNFHVPLLEEAVTHTKYGIVNNQFHYSLSARAYEENGTVEFCRRNGILVTAYRPIGRSGELSRHGVRLLDEISEKYGKTPAQVAVNWVIAQPDVVTLVKTSNPEHLQEDLGALGWSLSGEDNARLRDEFPRGQTINVPDAPLGSLHRRTTYY